MVGAPVLADLCAQLELWEVSAARAWIGSTDGAESVAAEAVVLLGRIRDEWAFVRRQLQDRFVA